MDGWTDGWILKWRRTVKHFKFLFMHNSAFLSLFFLILYTTFCFVSQTFSQTFVPFMCCIAFMCVALLFSHSDNRKLVHSIDTGGLRGLKTLDFHHRGVGGGGGFEGRAVGVEGAPGLPTVTRSKQLSWQQVFSLLSTRAPDYEIVMVIHFSFSHWLALSLPPLLSPFLFLSRSCGFGGPCSEVWQRARC